MDGETGIRNILNSVEVEARQLLVVDQRTDYGDVRRHLYNFAWSQFDCEFDDHEAYKDQVIDKAKRIIDDWIVIAYDLTKHSASIQLPPRGGWPNRNRPKRNRPRR